MEVPIITTIMVVYLIVAGKAQFTVQPLSVEKAEGLEAMFRCQYEEEGMTVTYEWFINNFLVSTDTATVRDRRPPYPGGPATLTIVATLQHNNSVVKCLTTFRNGTAFVRSEESTTATLTVYATIINDVLSAPNTITVTWNAQPITEYCVDITRTTLDSTETVTPNPMCGFTDPYIFTYSNPISVCDRFSFTVTPTDGEIRGTTSEPDTGFFTRVEGSGQRHSVLENGLNEENKLIKFNSIVPNCTSFTRYCVDFKLLIPSINLSITDPLLFDGSLSFSLPTDKMTEYNVTLTDEKGINLVFENIPISTFDVQDLLVSECPSGGCISASIKYAEGTLSPGALVIVMSVVDGVLDYNNMRLVPISSENFIIPVYNGSYRVIAFDLEKNFLPRNPLMAADTENVTVNSGSEDTTSPPRSSREGVSATILPSGDVKGTCSDSVLNCLVLFQSSNVVIVGFINSTYNSTVLDLKKDYGDGKVVVYSWNSSQSIFEGEVSLIKELDPPTSAPTAHTTSNPQTTPPNIESLPTPVIIGAIVVAVVIILVVCVCLVVVCLVVACLRKKSRKGEPTTYNLENNSQGGSSSETSRDIALRNVPRPENASSEQNTAVTDDTPPPGYEVVHKENLPSPEYETVPLAKAGKPIPTTSENPPPLPPPMIQGDSEAPDLPPPYNPAVDNKSVVVMSVESSISQSVENQSVDVEVDESLKKDLSVSDTEHDGTTAEEAIGSTEAQPDVNRVDTVQGAEGGAGKSADYGGQEAMVTAQHQCMQVETKPADKVKDSTKVVLKKDKLVPVNSPDTQVHGNEPEALPPEQKKNNFDDPPGVDSLRIEESNQLGVDNCENDESKLKMQCNQRPKQKNDIHFEAGLPLNCV